MAVFNDPKVVLAGIKGEFLKVMSTVKDKSNFEALARVLNSERDTETYTFLETATAIREFMDKVQYDDYKAFNQSVKNIPFSEGTMVDRFTLDDSKKDLGAGLVDHINSIVQNWITFPDSKLNDLLIANPDAFDGTAFFANARPNLNTGAYTIDNIVTGTGTSIAQLTADLNSAIAQMDTFRDKTGQPFNMNPKYAILCPAHLHRNFREIVGKEFLAGGENNINWNIAEIVVNYPQLQANNDWYLVNTANPVKPFLIQKRQTPTWEMEDKKDERYIKYFSIARTGFALLNPLAVIKVDN